MTIVLCLAALPASEAEAQPMPALAFTSTPTTIDAGTVVTVTGEGCPSEMPSGYHADHDIAIHVAPVQGNIVHFFFEGAAGDATATMSSTMALMQGEQPVRYVEANADGTFAFDLYIPWWDGTAAGSEWRMELACYTLGPVGPFDQGLAPAATINAPNFSVVGSARPSLDRLQALDAADLVNQGVPLAPPTPPSITGVAQGGVIDARGHGCRPPQPDDVPGSGVVLLSMWERRAGGLPRLFDVVVADGSLVVSRLALEDPSTQASTISRVRPDGSWSASLIVPATAHVGADLVVRAVCLTDIAAGDLALATYTPQPWLYGGWTYGYTQVSRAPVVAVPARPSFTG